MSSKYCVNIVNIAGSLRDREVACSASDRQGSNFESCVWRKVSSHSSHHPQEVLLAQFSLYVHKGGLKPDSFHLLYPEKTNKPQKGSLWPEEILTLQFYNVEVFFDEYSEILYLGDHLTPYYKYENNRI